MDENAYVENDFGNGFYLNLEGHYYKDCIKLLLKSRENVEVMIEFTKYGRIVSHIISTKLTPDEAYIVLLAETKGQ